MGRQTRLTKRLRVFPARAGAWRCLGACLLACLPGLSAWAQEPDQSPIQVIAHASVNDSFLNRSYLRSVFTLRVRTWPDGQPVHIFVLEDGSQVHSLFAREILGTYPYVLRRTWDRSMFTGTGLVPVRVENLEEMRRRVRNTPGAVGYLPSRSAESSQGMSRRLAGRGEAP